MTRARSLLQGFRLRPKSDARKIFIVFNPSGLVFVVFVVALFMASRFQTGGGGLPWVLGIALIVAGLVGMIQTNDNLHGIFVTKIESDPVPAGVPATLHVTIANQSKLMRHALALRLSSKNFWKNSWLLDSLSAGESAGVMLTVSTPKRGIYPFPKLLVSTSYPLNICFAWKRFAVGGEMVVYPEPRGRPLKEFFATEGTELSATQPRGEDDVTDLRPFEAGDSPSRLDWRVYARTNTLMIRNLENGPKEILLSWESTSFISDSEARLCQLSRWIDDCLSGDLDFRLQLGKNLTFSRHQLIQCRRALASFDPESTQT
jgi:uncharacterized protein (DUF58 family)